MKKRTLKLMEVYSYTCKVISLGLLFLEFNDEGDGLNCTPLEAILKKKELCN